MIVHLLPIRQVLLEVVSQPLQRHQGARGRHQGGRVELNNDKEKTQKHQEKKRKKNETQGSGMVVTSEREFSNFDRGKRRGASISNPQGEQN